MLSTLRNKVSNIYKKAFEAFYEFSFPKGVRWYRINQEVKVPRYPAPGSEPISCMFNPTIEYDYKTSYRDSHYNIRYEEPHQNKEQKILIHEALGETVEEKMIRLGLIEKCGSQVTLKIESAKEMYQKMSGKKADSPNCNVIIQATWTTMDQLNNRLKRAIEKRWHNSCVNLLWLINNRINRKHIIMICMKFIIRK